MAETSTRSPAGAGEREVDLAGLLLAGWAAEPGDLVQQLSLGDVLGGERLAGEAQQDRGQDVLEPFAEEVLALVLAGEVAADLLGHLPHNVAAGPLGGVRVHHPLEDPLKLRVRARVRQALARPRLALRGRGSGSRLGLRDRGRGEPLGSGVKQPVELLAQIRGGRAELAGDPGVEGERPGVPRAPGLGLVALVAVRQPGGAIGPQKQPADVLPGVLRGHLAGAEVLLEQVGPAGGAERAGQDLGGRWRGHAASRGLLAGVLARSALGELPADGRGEQWRHGVPDLPVAGVPGAVLQLAWSAGRCRGDVEAVGEPLQAGGLADREAAWRAIVVGEVGLGVGGPRQPMGVQPAVGVVVPA